MRGGVAVRWIVLLLTLGLLPATRTQAACDPATQYTYAFESWCAEPVWIGQRSTGDHAAYPPEAGNWALAARCATNADCPSGVCDANSGQCTCTTAGDCPGGAACAADGKCSPSATFCMPQAWPSGTFWPRTGCTLDASVTPATLACATGACFATDDSGKQLLECSVANGGGSPTNPVTQFEVTSTPTALNYDVSIAAGYNVETRAVPVGGGQVVPGTPASDVVACYPAGCTADLRATCPAALQVLDGDTVIGCLDPCTRCQRAAPPASLACDTALSETWSCDGNGGAVTNVDLYCAKNTTDGAPQASPNQGTPTAFSQLDCPPVTTFVTPTFASGYALPAGQGVCLYTSPPQSTIPHFNDYGWADSVSGTTKNCGGVPPDYVAPPDGTACGGYLTSQTGGGVYTDAIGYTCQTATYPIDGGMQTAHLCMPPVTTGLGTCTQDSLGQLPLYSAVGGVANQAWLDAAKLAGGGGTPYYVPFKTACQAAYAWQYDDIASGFGCTPGSTVAGGAAFSGFDVTFCGSRALPGVPAAPDRVVALNARGRAAGLDRPGRGRLEIRGRAMLATSLALADTSVVVTDLLDHVGGAGELVAGSATLPLPLTPRKRRKTVAVFETDPGAEPRVKVVLQRLRPQSERVKVTVMARRATIARPAVCEGPEAGASLETGMVVGVGADDTRVGTIGRWRCTRKALRGG